MKWLTLDTQVWQYALMPASRNVRRELVWATEALGFQLAYTDELVREIVDTKKDWKTARRVAEAVGELTSDVMVESNHAANARELCDALRGDQPGLGCRRAAVAVEAVSGQQVAKRRLLQVGR